jgi:hypothetical protein
LASTYNAITVGLTSGAHESGNATPHPTPGLGIYSGNALLRTRPDLVAPQSFTSYATPLVSGAAALLIELGHNDPGLSHGSQTVPEGPDYVIQNAETSEVIRSALMAGANRQVWTDYGSSTFASANGLDARYGAGQLDVYQSYHILAAGEHDSQQAGQSADMGAYGFDYQPQFAAQDVATYSFSVGLESLESLSASLAWNAAAEIDVTGLSPTYSASLANFDLLLYKLTDAGRSLVEDSLSTQDNTENLWLASLGPGDYELEVLRADDGLGNWDYGLSWHRAGVGLSADLDGDGLVGLTDFGILKAHFGEPGGRAEGDVDGNGLVDLTDFGILKSSFGKTFEPMTPDSGLAQSAVPEPAGLLLAALGGLLTAGGSLVRRRRRS